jgi:glycerol-3-phosphate dehydrogenase
MDVEGPEDFDLLVIGGGINGAGIARDAAGRRLKVCLVEQGDLASATSSASTKLVNGGLRYLEHYEFRLVRESLIERERLLAIAPHIIWPLRFVLPHHEGLRPKWLLRAGLFLYDHMGGRTLLAPTCSVNLRKPPHADILEERLTRGFEYSDCWVDDARLVVLNCVDARERGANIRTRSKVVSLKRRSGQWEANISNAKGEHQINARMIVNAAGPWVDRVINLAFPGRHAGNVRLVKGSHLIMPRLYDGDHCYIFQNRDGRIIFAIPYERDFTLLGTTEVAFDGDPAGITISPQEAAYICDAANEYLKVDVTPEQAVSSYAGVRPLNDVDAGNNSTVTRDYTFNLDRGSYHAAPPILSIFGGKITTYRKLAERALERLGVPGKAWTANKPLPGGEIDPARFEAFVKDQQRRWPWIGPQMNRRLARAYGTRMARILAGATGHNDLGTHMGGGLYSAELAYLVNHELARTPQDVLWRRSKLGLHLSAEEKARVTEWFARVQLPD